MRVIDTVTVPKIGSGVRWDKFRPDTAAEWWRVVGEPTETTFTIEILEP